MCSYLDIYDEVANVTYSREGAPQKVVKLVASMDPLFWKPKHTGRKEGYFFSFFERSFFPSLSLKENTLHCLRRRKRLVEEIWRGEEEEKDNLCLFTFLFC